MHYWNYSSCPPKHVKKFMLKSLSIRAKSICSENTGYLCYLNKLNNSLMPREFPTKLNNNQTQHEKYVKNVDDHQNNLKYYPNISLDCKKLIIFFVSKFLLAEILFSKST